MSANFTLLRMMVEGNFEQFMISKINKQEFERYKSKFFIAAQQAKQINPKATDVRNTIKDLLIIEEPMQQTPKKGHVTQLTPFDDINKALIKRIQNTSSEGIITIITYTLDASSFSDALAAVRTIGVHIRIIKGSSEAQQKIRQLLEGAQIHVYKNKAIKKNHAKLILIKNGDRIVCGHGSYNFTPTSQTSFNAFHWLAKPSATATLNLIKSQWEALLKKAEPLTLNAETRDKPLRPMKPTLPISNQGEFKILSRLRKYFYTKSSCIAS